MATFQIHKYGTQYHYSFRATNNEIVQSSEGYTTKASCKNGIQSVKANCQPQRFQSFLESGQYGFNHVAANGEIIGRSEKYTTAQSRDHGIQVVLSEAPEAPVQVLN